MKLYEFTYHDKENLSDAAIVERLTGLLETEAEMQGWASGYNLRQCKEVVQQADGERVFNFEVLGAYIDSENIDFEEDIQRPAQAAEVAVAKEADL